MINVRTDSTKTLWCVFTLFEAILVFGVFLWYSSIVFSIIKMFCLVIHIVCFDQLHHIWSYKLCVNNVSQCRHGQHTHFVFCYFLFSILLIQMWGHINFLLYQVETQTVLHMIGWGFYGKCTIMFCIPKGYTWITSEFSLYTKYLLLFSGVTVFSALWVYRFDLCLSLTGYQ